MIKSLEHFQKYCSHSETMKNGAVFLGFGFVSAQSQGFAEPAPSPKPRQNPKILAPNGCRFFSNALVKLCLLCLLAIAATATPIALRAEDATATATNKPAIKAPVRRPFRGKIKVMNSTAMTITVGNNTYQITSQTRITKDGKPATFGDGAVGDNVAGSAKKDTDGKLNAVSINFGTKPTKSAAPSATTTNTP